MAYDKKTSTITVGEGSNFTKDSFLHFEAILEKLAKEPNCPQSVKDEYEQLRKANQATRIHETLTAIGDLSRADTDAFVADGLYRVKQIALTVKVKQATQDQHSIWSSISKYCHCGIEGNLTEAMEQEIKLALRQYYNRRKLGVEPLPDELLMAFDKLFLASVSTIQTTKTTISPLDRLHNLSRWKKAGLVSFAIWSIYVWFRTSDYHHFFGHSFERWYSDEFLVNWLAPPIIGLVITLLVKWVLIKPNKKSP